MDGLASIDFPLFINDTISSFSGNQIVPLDKSKKPLNRSFILAVLNIQRLCSRQNLDRKALGQDYCASSRARNEKTVF
jgi:hypothetical protein